MEGENNAGLERALLSLLGMRMVREGSTVVLEVPASLPTSEEYIGLNDVEQPVGGHETDEEDTVEVFITCCRFSARMRRLRRRIPLCLCFFEGAIISPVSAMVNVVLSLNCRTSSCALRAELLPAASFLLFSSHSRRNDKMGSEGGLKTVMSTSIHPPDVSANPHPSVRGAP